MVADFLVVFLIDTSHLVAAAAIPSRKLIDLEMSLLVAAGFEIDDLLRHPHAPLWRLMVTSLAKCRPRTRVAGSAFTRSPSCDHLMQLEIVWTVLGLCRL